MRTLYISGGSAGHLAPLVAVERAVKKLDPQAESFFLCSEKPEDAAYLRSENVSYAQLPLPRRSWTLPWKYLHNYLQARSIILTYKPDIIFSKGSAVSVPACLAAKHLKIPIVLHESDAVMGKANAMVARWAETICLGFSLADIDQPRAASDKQLATSRFLLLASRFIVTGNPIREDITKGSREEGLRITGFEGKKPVLLIIGGSQGAEALNNAVSAQIDDILSMCNVIHLTGKGKKGAPPQTGYWQAEFAHEELPHLYACASYALSRAGAGAITELAANRLPTILVPIEGLANDHQVRNAEVAEREGGYMVVRQRDLHTKLLPSIRMLRENETLCSSMKEKRTCIYHPDAARRIAEILMKCLAHKYESY